MYKYLITVVMLIMAGISYYFFDFPVSVYLHSIITPTWHHIGGAVSYLGDSLTYTPVLLMFIIFLVINRRHWLFPYLTSFVAVLVSSGLITDGIKLLVGRARPYVYFKYHLYGFYGPNIKNIFHSFPSGHVTTAAAIFMLLALCFPRIKYICYLLILSVCIARIITFNHFISDTLVGWLIGAAMAYLFYYLLIQRKLIHKK